MARPIGGWRAVLAAGLVVAIAGCGGGGSGGGTAAATSTSAEAATSTSADEPTSTSALPAGATAGFDDYDGDGTPEALCATRDFGAGLVLRLACRDLSGYANDPSADVTLVPGSLAALPSTPDDVTGDLVGGASGSAVRARDPEGHLVVVVNLSADTIFAVGSAQLAGPAKDSLGAIAAGIQRRYPGAAIQVRGHTDATGSAPASQALSEQRAASASAFLATQGIPTSGLHPVGLGSTAPIALERAPDGKDSAAGRAANRRIELVVRPA